MNTEEAPAQVEPEDEVTVLISTLLRTEQRLEELTGGEVDTVASKSGQPFMLRRAQEQMQRSKEEKLEAILNALPAHIALLDAEGRIITVNEAWRHFGQTNLFAVPRDGAGLNYLAVCDRARGSFSAEAHQVAAGIRSVLQGEAKNFSIEYPCHSPEEQRWFLLIVTPLAGGQIPGAVVMHLNITERRRAEQQLRETEARFVGAFEHAPSGVALVAPDGRWLKVNRALCDLLGYTEAELVGQTTRRLYESEEEYQRVGRELYTDLPKRGVISVETRLRRSDGAFRDVILTAAPLNPGDPSAGDTVAIYDMTERKRTEEARRESERKYQELVQRGRFGGQFDCGSADERGWPIRGLRSSRRQPGAR